MSGDPVDKHIFADTLFPSQHLRIRLQPIQNLIKDSDILAADVSAPTC